MKQIELREGARRQHRALAMLGAMQCWVRGLDGVVFNRDSLERLIGLVRFKQTRVDWLKEDVGDLFPWTQVFVTEENKSINSLLACRRPLPNDQETLGGYRKWCSDNGISVDSFSIWPATGGVEGAPDIAALSPFFGQSVNSDERLMTSYLSLIATGQMSVLDVPGIKPAQ